MAAQGVSNAGAATSVVVGAYTIMSVLVYAADGDLDDSALTPEEEDVKAVQLVEAVAQQIRNFHKMTVDYSAAIIISMN